jgi:hypothetical protein
VTGQGDRRGRPLTGREQAAVTGVSIAAGGLALIGFANSFRAVMQAAWPTFGVLAPTVPLGIDLGIAIFAAMDLVLARLDMRPRWLRLVPWALTAATVYLNVTGQPTWFGRVAHAVFPCLWVLAVEVGAHVVRIRAGLAAGTAMDRVRASRWLLAPWRTAGLRRRMVLWEIRSYPAALSRERGRVLARTGLQDDYGAVAWRWKAPRRVRALYRLGELEPVREPAVPEPVPVAVAVPEPAALAAGPAVPGPGPVPVAVAAVPEPARAVVLPAPPAVPDGDAGLARLAEWLTAGGEDVPAVPGPPAGLNGHGHEAAEMFAAELAAGDVPGIRAIRAGLHVGQDRARQVQAYLATLTPGAVAS